MGNSRDYNLSHPYYETLKTSLDLYSETPFDLSEEVMPAFASQINPHKVFHLMKYTGGIGDLSSIDSSTAALEDWREKGRLLDLKKYKDSTHSNFTAAGGKDGDAFDGKKVNSGPSNVSVGEAFDGKKVNSGPSNVSVSPQVHLFLEAKSLEFEMTNQFGKPIAALLDKLINSTVGKVANDGLAIIAGAGAVAAQTDNANVDSIMGKIQDLAPDVADSQKFMLKFKNIPAWTGTDNLSLPGSLTFKFGFGQAGLFDAAEEVVRPILSLAMYFAPIDAENGTVSGILPTESFVKIKGAIAVADGATQAISNVMSGNGILNAVSAVYLAIDGNLASTYKDSRGVMVARYGNIIIPPFVVSKVRWKFDMSEVDENGYPYKGEITLSGIESFQMATQDLVAHSVSKQFMPHSAGKGSDK